MRAGSMDRRLRIDRQVAGPQEPSGGETYTWSLVAYVWGEEKPLRGDESFLAGQSDVATVWRRFRIYFREDVTPERMRIVDSSNRAFDIIDVQEIGRREGLEIYARARGETP